MDKFAAYFWEGCALRELRYQRCGACNRAQYPARAFCAGCGARELAWCVSQGIGSVYALTNVTRAPSDAFRALAPYVIALVDLDEGYRMMAHADAGVAIDDRVRVDFARHEDRHLPRFLRLR